MDISENIKSGLEFVGETVSEIASSIAEKNRLRVQLNHIKGLIKADTATRDQAYIELGRYFYENLREGTTAENEAICTVIDAASDRISKASVKYVELLNIQNDTKVRSENAEKLAKAVSQKASGAAKAAMEKGTEAFDKAKDFAATTAEKAKTTAVDFSDKAKTTAADLSEKAKNAATDLKDKAVGAAEGIKERFDPEFNEDLEELIAAEQQRVAEAEAQAAEAVEAAKSAVEEAVEEAVPVVPEMTDEESPEDIGF